MTDEYKRELHIPLPQTDTGKVQMVCPRGDCEPGRFFLGDAPSERPEAGNSTPTRREPGTDGVTCPYCGKDDSDDAFRHPDDAAYLEKAIDHGVEEVAHEMIGELLDNHFTQPFKRMGRASRRSGFSVTVESRPYRQQPKSPPRPPARADLPRNVTCTACARAYGVFAIALFCPDCGSSNVLVHFARERRLCEDELASARETSDRERALRKLGNAHEDAVSATEAYLKSIYALVIGVRRPADGEKKLTKVGNAFQSIERGKKLFAPLGVDLYGMLMEGELKFLDASMAKRHVVTHNLGVVDKKHVERTGQGKAGELISLTERDVRRHLELVERVISDLERSVPELQPSP
ncbi:MAG: hypothetical protein ACRBN8_38965 [Nannocystales bacterium]